MSTTKRPVVVIGAGTMGSGIAQVALQAGHAVTLADVSDECAKKGAASIEKGFAKLVEKGRYTADDAKAALSRLAVNASAQLAPSANALVIEAIVENPDVKRALFQTLAARAGEHVIWATNTSSLSVTAIAQSTKEPERTIGLHFFNPAPLMQLVEIVPALQTDPALIDEMTSLMRAWGKTPVVCQDTPGFIVNRIARPFYGESLRILEEGVADVATIDWALTEIGGFRMGPFALMDLIGNDINFAVTQSVWSAFFFDPRYRPSLTQQRMVAAGRFGRKSGRGYFDYSSQASNPEPRKDTELGSYIVERVRAMLINEAVDALFLRVATRDDIETAMTKGVNYPKGLLHWCDELGAQNVLRTLESLFNRFGEDRYRPSPMLRDMAEKKERFFE